MQPYLLIASRDPHAGTDVESFYALAASLVARGHPVTLFLVQNGVLPARRGFASGLLAGLAENGVRLFADDFSLRERGITGDRLVPGIEPAPLDHIIDALASGARTLWS